jgi:hypothetical protein
VTHAKVNGRSASVTIACTGPVGNTCADSLTLSALETLRAGKLVAVTARTIKRAVTLGRATMTVNAGQTATVSISLNSTGQSLLKRRHKLPVGLIVSQGSAGGMTVVKAITLTFAASPHSRSRR